MGLGFPVERWMALLELVGFEQLQQLRAFFAVLRDEVDEQSNVVDFTCPVFAGDGARRSLECGRGLRRWGGRRLLEDLLDHLLACTLGFGICGEPQPALFLVLALLFLQTGLFGAALLLLLAGKPESLARCALLGAGRGVFDGMLELQHPLIRAINHVVGVLNPFLPALEKPLRAFADSDHPVVGILVCDGDREGVLLDRQALFLEEGDFLGLDAGVYR